MATVVARLRLLLLGTMFTSIISGCAQTATEPAGRVGTRTPAGPAPWQLSVVTAPADGGVLLSWIAYPGTYSYAVKWRPVNTTIWTDRAVGALNHVFIPQLSEGTPYEFVVSAARAGVIMSADTARGTPRARDNCAYPDYLEFQSYFCSQVAADAWMKAQGITPQMLECRNLPVNNWGPDAGDCLYSTGTSLRMLLLRSADTEFNPPRRPPSVQDSRAMLRQAIWASGDPFGAPDAVKPSVTPDAPAVKVTKFVSAEALFFATPGALKSRVTHFTPRNPVAGHYAIFHEGHGGAATDIGADMIDFLLERGWDVYAMDMPLFGGNGVDQAETFGSHWDMPLHDDGVTSILAMYMRPVKQLMDYIEASRPKASAMLLMGRSGGAWTAHTYATLDPRVTAVVSVAGGRPMSQRLDAPWGPLEIGDTEQSAPEVYAGIRHEDLMVAGGSRGTLLMFNTWDPCCYRVSAGDPFIDYLVSGGARTGRLVRAFVDPVNQIHGIGPAGFVELDRFLDDVTR